MIALEDLVCLVFINKRRCVQRLYSIIVNYENG